jgi:RNA polymerase sigma factor (sigma-70 family)
MAPNFPLRGSGRRADPLRLRRCRAMVYPWRGDIDDGERMADTRDGAADLADLLARAKAGDRAALDELLIRLHTIIARWASRRMGDARAESYSQDVALEALMRVRRHYRSCRAESDREVRAWAIAIARNEALRLFESGYFRYAVSLAAGQIERPAAFAAHADSEASERGAWHHLRQLAGAAQDSLPRETQRLLFVRLIEGASWREVAEEFGTTDAGAKRRYQRAVARLRGVVLSSIASLPENESDEVRRALGVCGVEID